ncbi:MAG: cell wall-binding repeat-containing protein, partial [Actinomycetia bacterium]|nr:cell wall-binding repeat-containing protein [Actinomycetes bacterium]
MKKYVFPAIIFLLFIICFAIEAEEEIIINGRGSGHGVGLCLAGAEGMADNGFKYEDILRKYYTDIKFGTVDEIQLIKVGILSQDKRVRVEGEGSFQVFEKIDGVNRYIASGNDGQSCEISFNGSRYNIILPQGVSTTSVNPVIIKPINNGSLKIVNYYGEFNFELEIKHSLQSGLLWVICEIPLNEYLYGIAEVPESWNIETLKTVAIKSRSLAVYKKEKAGSNHKIEGFDICAGEDCQVFVGKRNAPNFKKAVDETEGKILSWGEEKVKALSHFVCGGYTEDYENVFGDDLKPYLKGVYCGYDNWHPLSSWKVRYPESELESLLNSNVKTKIPGRLERLKILEIGISPRAKTVEIQGSDGSKMVSGNVFREVLNLSSTWFIFRPTRRISGETRYKTAIAISREGWQNTDYVILATGKNFPDALTASTLSHYKNAPILLIKDELDDDIKNEINRLSPNEIIIVGGKGVVGENIENKISGMGIKQVRIAGADRYSTSVEIAKSIRLKKKKVIITTGENFPDALSISSYAAYERLPILLVKKDDIPTVVKTYLKENEIEETLIIGGEGVISKNVENILPNPQRIGGSDRYETAKKVVELLYPAGSCSEIYFITGENFPDGLAT